MGICFTDLDIPEDELFILDTSAPYIGVGWTTLWFGTNSWFHIDENKISDWLHKNFIFDFSFHTVHQVPKRSDHTSNKYYFVIGFKNKEDAALFKFKDGEQVIFDNDLSF